VLYLIATIVGLLASVISSLVYVKTVAARYRRRLNLTEGEIGVSIVGPVSLVVVIASFVAGFYAVLRISN
jgi:hypothetical protein